MLSLYIASAIIAGALIVISALGGDHDSGGHDFGGGHDLGSGHDLGAGGHDAHHDTEGAWIPFLSLRFWTYFAASFGAIGLILTLLAAASATTTVIVSLVAGLATGLGVAFLMQWIKKSSATSSSNMQDLIGKQGQVLVAVRPAQLGKVRIESKGEMIDLLVMGEEGQTIEPGQQVFVTAVEGHEARVALPRDVLGD